MPFNHKTNIERAQLAWGDDMPRWIGILASECDKSTQPAVAAQLKKSGPYISRIINRDYAGSYDEAEKLVLARFGGDDVACPLWGDIPLSSCLRNRRRKGPPINQSERAFARECPNCLHNTDKQEVSHAA